LDLVIAMRSISTRRFFVLLRGLSPHSATVTKILSGKTMGSKESVNHVRDPKDVDAFFEARKAGAATLEVPPNKP
jgi:hypothetical protein